ncbi:Signal peptidase I W [Gulosibacter molinativorax]|nr:Signal peptidase I W [Gulosibacter molinativorax]
MLLSAAALVVVGWIAYSAITGATLVIFRTGSMSPTMPQGALAIAEPISASDIVVGDVVTVDRSDEGRQPITHRVIEIREGSVPGSAEIRMQGDANPAPDQEAYVVTDVMRVTWSMPGLGTVLMVLQSPLGMTALTLLAGTLTVWAFWPAPAAARPSNEVARDDAR